MEDPKYREGDPHLEQRRGRARLLVPLTALVLVRVFEARGAHQLALAAPAQTLGVLGVRAVRGRVGAIVSA
jgi:hypothetical protein